MLLLDTQLLLWILYDTHKLSRAARTLLIDPNNRLLFSSVSIWEIAIKQRQRNAAFSAEAQQVHRQLVSLRYAELTFTSEHALATRDLPMIHKDPFDRALLAQALFEQATLVTADKTLATYPGAILLI